MDQTGVHVPEGGEPLLIMEFGEPLGQQKLAFEFNSLELESASEGSLEYPPLLEFLALSSNEENPSAKTKRGTETSTKPLPLSGLPEGIFFLPPRGVREPIPYTRPRPRGHRRNGLGGMHTGRTNRGGGRVHSPSPAHTTRRSYAGGAGRRGQGTVPTARRAGAFWPGNSPRPHPCRPPQQWGTPGARW